MCNHDPSLENSVSSRYLAKRKKYLMVLSEVIKKIITRCLVQQFYLCLRRCQFDTTRFEMCTILYRIYCLILTRNYSQV